MNDRGCVVMSLRADRDILILRTPDGDVEVHLHAISKQRMKAVVHAPRSVEIRRRKTEVTNDAV